jgi:aminoglycoside phosphotransferase family enzyme
MPQTRGSALRPLRIGVRRHGTYACAVDIQNIELAAKVAFLSRPETYPERPLAVECVETHFAWVFIAGRFVYKLKKPQRFHDFDFTTLAARRANCELEVALNRRLAPKVYLGTVALRMSDAGLSLHRSGIPVEWLVKMQRLPRDRSLDRLAAAKAVEGAQLEALMAVLARFYEQAAVAPWDGRAYRRALVEELDCTASELEHASLGLDGEQVRAVADLLRRFTVRRADLLHGRVAAQRVVDTHGDLRPEHIFLLTPEPQIIDCLEFSAELRLQDTAAEIAFLALECERLGHPPLARRLCDLYRKRCRDDVAPALLEFYRAQRAFVRAKLAGWHLHEPLTPDAASYWRGRTQWYLDEAAASAARATARIAAPPDPDARARTPAASASRPL